MEIHFGFHRHNSVNNISVGARRDSHDDSVHIFITRFLGCKWLA